MTAFLSGRTMPWAGRRRMVAKKKGFDRIILAVASFILLVAVFGPIIAPSSVYQSNILASLGHPSLSHWFGTDEQGRDVFWRVVAGARYSVLSAVLIVAGYSVIGVAVATLATIGGRYVDEVVMRITDAGLALPPIIFALSLAAVLGPSLRSAIIALIATGWPFTARLLRGVMRETMETPFVEGAMVLGMSRRRLLWRHVLPNSLDVLIVKWAGDIGNTILVLAGLSFVRVGAQPPSPEWGAMVTDAQGYISSAWWATLAPGLAIALTSATFGLLGDLLQVRLNPNLGGEEPALVALAVVRPEEMVLT